MAVSVVVIDDTDHVRQMLVDMLELDGFEVAAASDSGTMAAELAVKHRPDVIIMDYAMPKMNGLDASREVLEAVPEQHIILYSAYIDANIEAEAREVGVAFCVGKTEGLGALERSIREAVVELGKAP